jgi:hypothetical protein
MSGRNVSNNFRGNRSSLQHRHWEVLQVIYGAGGSEEYGCDNFFFRSVDAVNQALGVVGWR